MALTLPEELLTSYPPAQRVVRRAFLLNLCLTSAKPGESAVKSPSKLEIEMAAREVGDKDVFMGIAGFKSLDLLCLLGKDSNRYKHAVLFDINEHQLQALRTTFQLVRKHENVEGFIKEFSERYTDYLRPPVSGEPDYHAYLALSQNEKELFYNAFGSSYQPSERHNIELYLERVQHGRESSWLAPGNYKHIREMLLNDDIAVATMDLRDKTRIATLKHSLAQQGMRVGDAYISSAMDFADPHLKTDYYSKGLTIEQARDFADNLLSIGDEKTKFVVSKPVESIPILQTYYMEHIDKEAMRKVRDAIPDKEPQWQDKAYSILLNAGGRVWRVQSFKGYTPDGTVTQTSGYFRIFPEIPVGDRAGLERQLGVINDALARQPGITTYPMPAVEKTADGQYFEYQDKKEPTPYFQLSSQVFQLGPDANENTIDKLIDRIRNQLDAPSVKVS